MTRPLRLRAIAWICLTAGFAQAQPEPWRPELTPEVIEGCLGDDHYGIYVNGSKCGWARIRFSYRAQPTPRYLSHTELLFKLTAMGDRTEMESRSTTTFAGEPPYAFVVEDAIERQGDQVKGRILRRTEQGLQAVTLLDGERRELQLDPVDYTLADSLAAELWLREPRQAGDAVTYRSLSSDEGRVELETQRVQALREVVLDGVETRVVDLLLTQEHEGELGTATVDAQGRALRMLLGGLLELRLEPEELAKQIDYSADLFVSGLARIDQPLGEADAVTRLELRVTGEAAPLLPDGPWQTVTRKDGETVLVIDVEGGARLPAADGDAERYLRATPEIPADHPTIQALAAEATGDAQTPADTVARLVHFVAEYVEDAYGQDQNDVLAVVARKVGDCTEHADLLTALGRAAGIPTRGVSGLVYMGDEVKAFGGHAWNEVLLDGHWVPVDATWDETTINATHVKFDHDGGKQMRAHGKLSFELRAVRPAR